MQALSPSPGLPRTGTEDGGDITGEELVKQPATKIHQKRIVGIAGLKATQSGLEIVAGGVESADTAGIAGRERTTVTGYSRLLPRPIVPPPLHCLNTKNLRPSRHARRHSEGFSQT